MSVVNYQCKNCGDNLNFDGNKGLLVCPSCSSEFNEAIEDTISVTQYNEQSTHEYECKNCGAALVTEYNTAATICVFCQSPMLLSDRLSGQYAPAKVIPFKMDLRIAHEKFKKWCLNGIITPNDFRMLERVRDIQGIYIPFWLFDINVKAKGTAECTKVRSSGDTRYTSHYRVSVNAQSDYYKLPADASIKMPDKEMDMLEPFHYDDLQSFNMTYLAGFGAQKYDYTHKDLLPRIKERVSEFMSKYIRENIRGYASVGSVAVNANISQKNAVYTLLPIYLMNYNYKGTVYSFVMNGQTGKVAGTPPISKIKLTLIFLFTGSFSFALLSFLFSIEGVEENISEILSLLLMFLLIFLDTVS